MSESSELHQYKYAISAQFTSAQKGNYILPIAAALSPRQDFMKVRMKEEIIVRESAFSIRQVFMAKAYHCKHMLMPAAIAYPSECCQLTVYLSFLRNPLLVDVSVKCALDRNEKENNSIATVDK